MANDNPIKFEDLKREMPYKWRVQSFSTYKPEATCVAYVDSRDVQKLLDEVVGPANWQDEYYAVKNNLFCKIGIRVNGEWTWKGDCGTESNVDKEKGEASDAFKRAAVKWGPGRFLYDLGMVKLKANEIKAPGKNPWPVDDAGNRIWDITKHINALIAAKRKARADAATPAKATPPPPEPEKLAAGKAALTISKPDPKTLEELQEDFKELMQNDVFTDDEREKALEPLMSYDAIKLAKVIAGTEKLIAKRQTAAA